jgi:class 3 adenylate cyclase
MMVVIGENTFEAVRGQFECRSLGDLELKGKAKKVTAYEVVAAAAAIDETPPGAASGGA